MYSIVPFKWRMGKSYRKTIRFLGGSQYWSPQMIEEYQMKNLKTVLDHAYRTVPYYRNLLRQLGPGPGDIKSFEDFQKIPLLSREELAANYETLKSSSYGVVNSYEGLTGGTTGSAVRLLLSLESNSKEWAYMHSLWARAGYSPDQKRVALIGTPFQGGRRVPYCLNPFHNELQLSALDLDESSMNNYTQMIMNYSPAYLYGLPSAWMVLGSYMASIRKVPRGIKAILCASEPVTGEQRMFLESVFGCKAYSWYGQTEKVALAGACEHSTKYHLFYEYGYTELVDDKGKVIRESGRQGEIVATGFINRAMPLIRYRTGDTAEYAGGESCPCGRQYRRLSRIIGRREAEYLIGKKNERIPLSAIDTQIPEFGNVRQAQFVQSEPGSLNVNILATPDITDQDARAIRKNLTVQLTGRVMVEVYIVRDLIRTSRGKVKPLIQKVKT